ncbi:MAG: hypothetical protein MN733_26435 [Nitrososphaera sp.]|nr:hypothetical protein [Nitrososphaera sp.]
MEPNIAITTTMDNDNNNNAQQPNADSPTAETIREFLSDLDNNLKDAFLGSSISNITDLTKERVRRLHPRHQNILRMRARGFQNVEIAEVLGLSLREVNNITRSGIFMAEEDKLQHSANKRVIMSMNEVRSKLEELSGVSVQQLEEMLDGTRQLEKKRADMCFDVLKMAGAGAPIKVEHEHVHSFVDATTRAFERRQASLAEKAIPITAIKVNGETVDLTTPVEAPTLAPSSPTNGNGENNE